MDKYFVPNVSKVILSDVSPTIEPLFETVELGYRMGDILDNPARQGIGRSYFKGHSNSTQEVATDD